MIGRRALVFVGFALVARPWMRQAPRPDGRRRVPEQAAATESRVFVPGGHLWCWDTGGDGEPIVLLHPGTGSALIWGYQQPVFAAAGYRVIAYSRRGYYNSDAARENEPESAAADLGRLLDALSIDRCHLVGSAAGAIVALDYALSNADRLLSLTLACTVVGAEDEDFQTMLDNVIPPEFGQMPPEFREISPSYRAVRPEGVREWVALEERAITGRRGQPRLNEIRWANIEKLDVPALVLAGEADLYAPPPLLRALADHLPNAEFVTLREVGHSAYWEAPTLFNDLVLRFIGDHRAQ